MKDSPTRNQLSYHPLKRMPRKFQQILLEYLHSNPKKPARKPEKLETFNETPAATEADDLEGTQTPQVEPKTPKTNSVDSRPGHRYFYLNGQSLFNYPFSPYFPQNVNSEEVLKYYQNYPKTRPQEVPVPVIPALHNPAFQNPQYQVPSFQHPQFQAPNYQNSAAFESFSPNQNKANSFPLNFDPYYQGNLIPQQSVQQPQAQQFQDNLPVNYLQPHVPSDQYNPKQIQQPTAQQPSLSSSPQRQINFLKEQPIPERPNTENTNSASKQKQASTALLRSILPLSVTPDEGQNVQIRVSTKDFNLQPVKAPEYPQYLDDIENDSVIIDAKFDDDSRDSEAVSVPAKQPQEPSLAQAEPGAIALAGPGGVAESGPRATAFVGKGGMAVSNPKATAIAGPAKDDEKSEDEDSIKNSKKEKYFRQRFRGQYI